MQQRVEHFLKVQQLPNMVKKSFLEPDRSHKFISGCVAVRSSVSFQLFFFLKSSQQIFLIKPVLMMCYQAFS